MQRKRERLLASDDSRDYGWGDAAAFERMRDSEYAALKDTVYLDHAASPPVSKTPLESFTSSLQVTLFSNPHSASTSSVATSLAVGRTRTRVLTDLFGVRPERVGEWDVVFTHGGATQGIKMVGEAWKWRGQEDLRGRNGLEYLVEGHTSLVGLRGIALARSSPVLSHRTPSSLLRSARSSRSSAFKPSAETPTLYTYPAQCNATGARLGLGFCAQIKRANPDAKVLIDAAAYLSTSVLDLGACEEGEEPDFVIASVYKIFGFPTSLGLLIVRRASAHLLSHAPYFGGGTVSSLSLSSPFSHTSRYTSTLPALPTFPPTPSSQPAPSSSSIHESLESGTPPFLEILALSHSLDWLNWITNGRGLEAVGKHVKWLRGVLVGELEGLRHAGVEKVFVEHRAFQERDERDAQVEEETVHLEGPGPVVGFSLLLPTSSASTAPDTDITDYRTHVVGHVHLSRLALLNSIALRSGGLCNTGVWTRVWDLSDGDLAALEAKGRKCWDEEEFAPFEPFKPLGIARVSLGLASTLEDILKFVEFVKKFFVVSEQVVALEKPLAIEAETKGRKVQRAKLKELMIYPIKSCAAQSLPSSTPWPLTPSGLLHDRELMLVSTSTGRALSQKRYSRMALIRPAVDREKRSLVVEAPGMEPLVLPLPVLNDDAPYCGLDTPPLSEDGHSLEATVSLEGHGRHVEDTRSTTLCDSDVSSVRVSSLADAWFTRFLNMPSTHSSTTSGPGPVELRRLPPGSSRHAHFDTSGPPLPIRLSNESPFLLVTSESLRALSEWIERDSGTTQEKEVKAAAFRPNIVVEGEIGDLPPFWEDEVDDFRVGGEVFATLGRCRRCLMVAVDQTTGQRTAEPLQTLSRYRKSPSSGRVEFGVHCMWRQELGRRETQRTISVEDDVLVTVGGRSCRLS
ncbi:molybdenum cofactor sulfurase [Rhodotorula toruloides]|uniref:Molybdenum cofactor sulfurase n=1 Tax=Rhodotorula toruloides TaxID=5286 RepID=A0A511KFX0_RHOTO|nr:molybdenum cofactor sulfurase [Rhodotorula toruloides]